MGEFWVMVNQTQADDAWDRASTVPGRDPETWRRDELGNMIRRQSYGTQGEYGWEIDHRNPVSNKGTDHGRNLRALHWEANRKKGDKLP
jgi:5-methylcytosine-specific restriction endonuclease McrA